MRNGSKGQERERKMNKTLNLENATNKTLNLENATSGIRIKTPLQILEERVAKLEEAVFEEPTEASGPADEEARIIINGNVDRKLYAKVCALCLSEDDVNVIYEKGGKEKARACFQNETKPVMRSFKEVMDKVGNAK